MLCIAHSSTDPYFNLAAEEYVLKNFSANCFMLWQNDNAIVVGKHQNTLAEINMDYIRKKNIRVVRRLSGGGAVYHDLGNLNFTFIMNGHEGQLVDFKKYTLPILEVLDNLSIKAKFEGRNDLTIDGKKFSGNAEHVYKKRVLHHGTLLFSSVMEDLNLALRVNPMKYRSKAVKSIRSRVTNISDHLKAGLNVLQFRDMIMDHIMSTTPGSLKYEFTTEDNSSITNLREEKYSTWEWNYGYSPKYDFQRSFNTSGVNIQVHMDVSQGIIRKVKIYGDFFNKLDITEVEELIVGTRHDQSSLLSRLRSIPFTDYFHNVTAEEFINGMF